MMVIRHWKTRTRLEINVAEGRVELISREGNVMFEGTCELFHACVARGIFELEGEE